MRTKKARGGKSCDHSFSICIKPTDTRDLARSGVLTKTSAMTLIDIDDLLPEDSDLATLARDASAAPPALEPPDGGAATA